MMNDHMLKTLPDFLAVLGLDEEPMGLFYTDKKPAEGFSPKRIDMPTREKGQNKAVIGGWDPSAKKFY
jgi:hypothetical protein